MPSGTNFICFLYKGNLFDPKVFQDLQLCRIRSTFVDVNLIYFLDELEYPDQF